MRLAERLAALRAGREPAAPPATPAATLPAALAQRLERLQTGARTRRATVPDAEVAQFLGGTLLAQGVVRIDQQVPLDLAFGRACPRPLEQAPLHLLGLPEGMAATELLLLDTETTGLSGGTGTLAFLLGLGRVDGAHLRLRQYVLTRFGGEAAMLADALSWIRPAGALVSFNGRSFDAPLLTARYRLCGHRDPLTGRPHLDLLPVTRRAFGHGWPDCRLQTAERELLGLVREDDVPGALIPALWAEFLRGAPPDALRGIARHNLLDLQSLAALCGILAHAYATPGHLRGGATGVARALARQGRASLGMDHLRSAGPALDPAGQLELAAMHRRAGQWAAARGIWETLHAQGCAAATLCLAKHHEHVEHNPAAALRLADILLEREPAEPGHARRRARLLRRVQAAAGVSADVPAESRPARTVPGTPGTARAEPVPPGQ